MQQLSAARGVKGVYVLVNREIQQFYIGSSNNIGERFYHHRGALRRGVHKNERLQSAWQEHGEDAFVFLIVQPVHSTDEIRPAEQAWLDASEAHLRGYNRSSTTHGAGWQYTPEQVARLSDVHRGKPKTPEHRAAMVAARARIAPEVRQGWAAAAGRAGRGKPKSAEHRRKIGAAQLGSSNHGAKLNDDKVRDIRRRLADGARGAHLAREFGVSECVISLIKTGRRWGHVTP